MDSYEERRQQRRDELHRYEMDVMYEVWRNNGNPDAINYERVSDHHYNGDTIDCAAAHELRKQRPAPQAYDGCEPEWPEEQEPQ